MSYQPPSLARKTVPLLIIIIVAGGAYYFLRHIGINQGYEPIQPLEFSHKLHAGELQIPCQYCHVDADKGRHASVPAMNMCMNCHSVAGNGKPGVEQLRQAYKDGKPLAWVRVHDVPDHVYFSHWQHIAKGVACQHCHGPVETMDRIQQVESLEMGWCVTCHRANGAPTECSTCHQ